MKRDHHTRVRGRFGTRTGPVLADGVVQLCPLAPGHAAQWHAGEDDEIRKRFQLARASTMDDVRAAIDRWRTSWREGGPVRHFGVWDLASGELAGGVELRDRGAGTASISYITFPGFRRRGLAARAVRLAYTYACDEMAVIRVTAIVAVDNVASRKVAAAAGFRLAGRAHPASETGVMLRFVRTLFG